MNHQPKAIEAYLEQVPHYDRFLTVDELFETVRRAAREHPDLATYREVGHSTDGEPIPMLSIGHGPKSALLYACPHPNEPIGAMLVQFLVEALLKDERLRGAYTWHLLPCVDPDGTRLNEGWFAGPFTVRAYARSFYRPRGEEQVEWTFPISYKRYTWDAPIPETQALMAALQDTRPSFVYSLHNAGFGGVYYYLSSDVPAAYPGFYRIPEALGLFLSKGEPEVPWAEQHAPAIFGMLSVPDAYEYYETYTDIDPVAMMHGGGSSVDYLKSVGLEGAVTLITELPYFQAPAVADETKLPITRREVLLAGLDHDTEISEALTGLLDRIEPEMTLDSRFWRASSGFIRSGANAIESQRQWALNDAATLVPATVAQWADALYVSAFYKILMASMLDRALTAQRALGDSGTLTAAQAELQQHLDRWITDIEINLPHTPIPIRKTVQAQLGAMLTLLPHLH
ncbi:M14 family zinc carboxypeptidase [Deinococcus sonorensis]|uniref:M14 family zinc carboxypeptidase n=2 Tax=Deinococcus sonorensis TaxID=309891 RepID=A0AAU7U5B9_9DEIO